MPGAGKYDERLQRVRVVVTLTAVVVVLVVYGFRHFFRP
jgi:hypothetical protein